LTRRLKLDIPGSDWRIAAEGLRGKPPRALFAPALPDPRALVVEIGFGRGEFLMDLAAREPDTAFLGIEVSWKRVHKMARRLARTELVNVRLLQGPAEPVVRDLLPDASVDAFWINFPDPWPKRRHHRRRLVQPELVRVLCRCLAPGGALEVATDHPEYATWIHLVLASEPGLCNLCAPRACLPEVPGRMHTAYEEEWRAEGRPLHFFRYARR